MTGYVFVQNQFVAPCRRRVGYHPLFSFCDSSLFVELCLGDCSNAGGPCGPTPSRERYREPNSGRSQSSSSDRSFVVPFMSVAPTCSKGLKYSSLKFSLPLNIRCSNRCAKPFFCATFFVLRTNVILDVDGDNRCLVVLVEEDQRETRCLEHVLLKRNRRPDQWRPAPQTVSGRRKAGSTLRENSVLFSVCIDLLGVRTTLPLPYSSTVKVTTKHTREKFTNSARRTYPTIRLRKGQCAGNWTLVWSKNATKQLQQAGETLKRP